MARIMLRPVGSPLPLGFTALGAASLVLTGLQLAWLPQDESHQVAIVVLAFAVPLELLASVFGFLVPRLGGRHRDGSARRHMARHRHPDLDHNARLDQPDPRACCCSSWPPPSWCRPPPPRSGKSPPPSSCSAPAPASLSPGSTSSSAGRAGNTSRVGGASDCCLRPLRRHGLRGRRHPPADRPAGGPTWLRDDKLWPGVSHDELERDVNTKPASGNNYEPLTTDVTGAVPAAGSRLLRLLGRRGAGRSHRTTRRRRLDVRAGLGLRRRVRFAHRRPRLLRRHPLRAVHLGWLLRSRTASSGAAGGSPTPGSSNAVRLWPFRRDPTGSCSFDGSLPGDTPGRRHSPCPPGGFGHETTLRDVHHHGRIWTGHHWDSWMRWQGPDRCPLHHCGPTADWRARMRVIARTSQSTWSLNCPTRPFDDEPVDPRDAWDATEDAWDARRPTLDDTLDPKGAALPYAVMRGLTSAGGGMVAAATTSLPERAEQGRNYDYRYVWIRDQAYAGQAAAAAGGLALLDEAVDGSSPPVSSMMAPPGPRLPDRRHRHPRSAPPRPARLPGWLRLVGNHVNHQFQLDAFGEALLLLAAAASHDRVGPDSFRAAQVAAAAIEARWQEPDAGIWEIDNRPWTHSRLICAAGLRQAARALGRSRHSRNRTAGAPWRIGSWPTPPPPPPTPTATGNGRMFSIKSP